MRALACDVTVHVSQAGASETVDTAVAGALRVFTAVQRACTRFDPQSPLMRANALADQWHAVPQILFDTVQEAHRAYLRTHGHFDPRVLSDLQRLGYDRSLPFEGGSVVTSQRGDAADRRALSCWRPRFRGGRHPELHLGGMAIDLGGIGKGLALRWARDRLAASVDSFLIDAGGDLVAHGMGPEVDGWKIGIEDPQGGPEPVAVLALHDRAVATSSIRLRQWIADGAQAHHLIDPASGRPGGRGLASVTVVEADPAHAEATTKSLFLGGRADIASSAQQQSAAALWVGVDGIVDMSARMEAHVIWRQS